MNAILVRIGIDHVYGRWNAPMNPNTGQFVFVPIPDNENKNYPSGAMRTYDEMASPLNEFARACQIPPLRLPPEILSRKMHLDPDFECLTYGDNGKHRGAGIGRLHQGDLLVFYAGLRSIVAPMPLVYALVGLFVIDEVVPASTIPSERHHENAHTRWTPVSDDDIVVRATPGVSGRFDRCIPIGEFRDNAYRVCRDTEDAWGGLAVKNGYIQRSAVPPRFLDAEKFYGWFQRKSISVLQRNN